MSDARCGWTVAALAVVAALAAATTLGLWCQDDGRAIDPPLPLQIPLHAIEGDGTDEVMLASQPFQQDRPAMACALELGGVGSFRGCAVVDGERGPPCADGRVVQVPAVPKGGRVVLAGRIEWKDGRPAHWPDGCRLVALD